MGLFQHKQDASRSPVKKAVNQDHAVFDAEFRQELRAHARTQFNKIIKENSVVFKKELEATVAKVSGELKIQSVKQLDIMIAGLNAEMKTELDKRFEDYGKTMRATQDEAAMALKRSAEDAQKQHLQISQLLEQHLTQQQATVGQATQESLSRIAAMNEAQQTAIDSLNRSVQAVQDQQAQLLSTMQQRIAHQETVVLQEFESNMSRIVEHYILAAASDQFDLKAQLPSIIRQLEDNKQAMMDDMKL